MAAHLEASLCWGAVLSGSACERPTGKSGGSFRDKFCTRCRLRGVTVPAGRVRVPTGICMPANCHAGGFWNNAIDAWGWPPYRVANQTRDCNGPTLVILKDDCLGVLYGLVPLPSAASDQISFRVMRTLVPCAFAAPCSPEEPHNDFSTPTTVMTSLPNLAPLPFGAPGWQRQYRCVSLVPCAFAVPCSPEEPHNDFSTPTTVMTSLPNLASLPFGAPGWQRQDRCVSAPARLDSLDSLLLGGTASLDTASATTSSCGTDSATGMGSPARLDSLDSLLLGASTSSLASWLLEILDDDQLIPVDLATALAHASAVVRRGRCGDMQPSGGSLAGPSQEPEAASEEREAPAKETADGLRSSGGATRTEAPRASADEAAKTEKERELLAKLGEERMQLGITAKMLCQGVLALVPHLATVMSPDEVLSDPERARALMRELAPTHA